MNDQPCDKNKANKYIWPSTLIQAPRQAAIGLATHWHTADVGPNMW